MGCIALIPARIPSHDGDSEEMRTVGFSTDPFAIIPLERLPARTWSEGHGRDPGAWWGTDREWGSHWRKYRDQGCRHVQARD